MFKRFLLLALVLGLMSSMSVAANSDKTIMIISDGGYKVGTTVIVEDPEGKDRYQDSALVEYLKNLGYNVDTSGMGSRYWRDNKIADVHPELSGSWWDADDTDGRKAALLDADLVIVSRFASSSRYDSGSGALGDRYYWNTLPTPLLTQNGPLIRGRSGATAANGAPKGSTKWGWNDGDNNRKYNDPTATDLRFGDMQSDGLTVGFFDFSDNPGNVNQGCFPGGVMNVEGRNLQNPTGVYPDQATIVGVLDEHWENIDQKGSGYSTDPPYQDKPILVDIPAGVDLDAFNNYYDGQLYYGVTGCRRFYFAHWSYDAETYFSWDQDITDMNKAFFALAVADMMVVPEPATIALLGLGGLSLLRRRR